MTATRPLGTRAALLVCASMLIACTAFAATFVVDSTGDEPDADGLDGLCRTALGTCTLRAAIEQANALAGADTIQFNIPGAGVHTISPASPLPPLTDDAGVTIDGYSQPGASANTLAIGDNAVLLIELDGTNAGGGVYQVSGLDIQTGSASIRGLVINRFDRAGILIEGGFGHSVAGCFLGTDASGGVSLGNGYGLLIEPPFSAVQLGKSSLPSVATVGGPSPADRNLMSGNAFGGIAATFVSNCVINNNYVGTDRAGRIALGPQPTGVSFTGSTSIILGSAAPNLISGNKGTGVLLGYGGLNSVMGNLIGTDPSGSSALPNGTGIQIVFESSDSLAGNLISGNVFYGIRLNNSKATFVNGNHIGTDITGASPLPNALDGIAVVNNSSDAQIGFGRSNVIAFNHGAGISVGIDSADTSNNNAISGNSIHDNGGLGIDLGADGITPNNDCDAGRGPNLLQNHPVLEDAAPVGTSTRIRGTLNSVPNSSFIVDFYSNRLCDPSGYGEGETYLGSAQVTTDASCNAVFEVTLPVIVAPGSYITATASDFAGNTSEFSACVPVTVGLDFYTITPCRVVDTRAQAGPYGGPALSSSTDRSFVIAGQCGIPMDAKAVAFNFTATQPSARGDVQIFPPGTPLPAANVLYYSAGQTRARMGVLALGSNGDVSTHVEPFGTVHWVIDVTGYFR